MLIAPIERLSIANPEMDGSQGSNRAPLNPREPIVNTDIAAALEFIRTHHATPTTQRNYRKEIERLILWSINVKTTPISSLTYQDMEEFIDFLKDPQPASEWVSGQKFHRDDQRWRPFVLRNGSAGLSTDSRLLSMSVLSSFFSWLVNYGYLIKNPIKQLNVKRKAVKSEAPKKDKQKVDRYFDEEMLWAFNAAIESMPRDTPQQQAHYERALFISAMMIFLAPRAHELAAGKMEDFKYIEGLWWWDVVGKGSVSASVPVVESMLKALIRYRRHLAFTPLPLPGDQAPLLASIRTGKPITTRQLNVILDPIFEAAAVLLEGKMQAFSEESIERAIYATRAAKIRSASSHWGRHTSITMQIRSGISKNIVQRNARHKDSNTTDRYIHEDQKYWHAESQKMHR